MREKTNIKDVRFIKHIHPANIKQGDIVFGVLPIAKAAEVVERGGRYFHLVVDVPYNQRGKELTAQDMVTCGAKFEEFLITRIRRK